MSFQDLPLCCEMCSFVEQRGKAFLPILQIELDSVVKIQVPVFISGASLHFRREERGCHINLMYMSCVLSGWLERQ